MSSCTMMSKCHLRLNKTALNDVWITQSLIFLSGNQKNELEINNFISFNLTNETRIFWAAANKTVSLSASFSVLYGLFTCALCSCQSQLIAYVCTQLLSARVERGKKKKKDVCVVRKSPALLQNPQQQRVQQSLKREWHPACHSPSQITQLFLQKYY